MRGTRAKACRLQIYGEGGSARTREWKSSEKPKRWELRIVDRLGRELGQVIRTLWRGTVTADPRRRAYQALKRSFLGRPWSER